MAGNIPRGEARWTVEIQLGVLISRDDQLQEAGGVGACILSAKGVSLVASLINLVGYARVL